MPEQFFMAITHFCLLFLYLNMVLLSPTLLVRVGYAYDYMEIWLKFPKHGHHRLEECIF